MAAEASNQKTTGMKHTYSLTAQGLVRRLYLPTLSPNPVTQTGDKREDHVQNYRVIVLGVFPPFPVENTSPRLSQGKAAPTEWTVDTESAYEREMLELTRPLQERGQGWPWSLWTSLPPSCHRQGTDSLVRTPYSTAIQKASSRGHYIPCPRYKAALGWGWGTDCRGCSWSQGARPVRRLLPPFIWSCLRLASSRGQKLVAWTGLVPDRTRET